MFITFEGGEGAGKTTQIRRLAARLKQALPSSDPLITREPGDGPLGPQLRALVLSARVPDRAELLIMMADRAQHVESVVRPALAAGRTVLCDRYADSSVAYQGYGRGLDLSEIAALNRFATGGLVPDHTILLDIDPSAGLARQSERTSMEDEDHAFHARVRNGFLEMAHAEPERYRIIDAARSEEEIEAIIWKLAADWHGIATERAP